VRPRSRIEGVLGRDPVVVNSLHHQSVDEVPSGWQASAWVEDVVEVIEWRRREGAPDWHAIGVQWHPELMPHAASSRALFAWLVAAASTRAGDVVRTEQAGARSR
jgi:putative glutamine amidotransferase